ncbi:gag/pol protein [Cucumis melo var. makuwa]|uniref:Gag/pol protein n=1 Tax=Cucumis melo var. makuwa TaxID=1194695 RepID=A0A5A7U1H1_CUCMM|nr:gag/pol protein [Cucumis melo var. makuwa]TYK26451.1 gag/pol protein [Cucumis melo var. makuwa]
MGDMDKDEWIKAMDLELKSMYFNSVWDLVDQPDEVKPIGYKWIYKRKRDADGKVQTFKVRLVANGYTQVEGVDYEETFSPIAMLKSIRILLSIAAYYDNEIWHEVTLSKEECPKTPQEVEEMRHIFYASAVGSLMYAMLCTRPDIYYAWAIANSREPRSHKHGKHIERKYHLIREIVHQGDVIVTQIDSTHYVVDPFTKFLTTKVFEGHLESLGLHDMPHLI